MKQYQPIKTLNQSVCVNGKVFYNDQRRRIDLKKPIKDLLGIGTQEAQYTMELCLNPNRTIERVTELTKQNIIPIILYFAVEGEKND